MFEAISGGAVPDLCESLTISPGPETCALLASVTLADLPTGDLVDVVVGYERLVAWAQAGQLAAIAELARRYDPPPSGPSDPDRPPPRAQRLGEPTPDEKLAAELGCALSVSVGSIQLRIVMARCLDERLPWVADALTAGLIDLLRARVMTDETSHLDDDLAAEVVLRVLPAAAGQTAPQLRRRIRAVIASLDPATAARRAKKAKAQRDVYLTPDRDGMATLGAVIAEGDAARAYAMVDQAARALMAIDRETGGPVRTLRQARADAFVDLLCGVPIPAGTAAGSGDAGSGDAGSGAAGSSAAGSSAARGPAGQASGPATVLTIMVPLAALLATEHRPTYGELSWVGPVSCDTARQAALAALSDLAGGRVGVRWVAVDSSGAAVAVTGTSYAPSPLLRAVMQARDRVCRFPGCTRPAEQCDGDHVEPYPRGATTASNLASLCRRHHRLKTHTGWAPKLQRDGTVAWTSPSGRSYRTHPGLWADPVDPPWQLDDGSACEPPPDPALTWTDAEYDAWVQRLCAQARTQAQQDGGGPGPSCLQPEATGPDLPPVWWAEGLTDW